MKLGDVGQIALGAVAGELLSAILDVKDKAVNFKDDLERLRSTLERMKPLIEEVKLLDAELRDHSRNDIDELEEQLRKGRELVQKCSKIHFLNIYDKFRYSTKFLKLDRTITRFFQLDVKGDMWLDNKRIRFEMKQMSQKVDRMSFRDGDGESSIRVGSMGSDAVPEIPDHVVGLDVPLKELKMELFREDVKVLGLCAPGGCGKTTLAAMLCQDEEVRDIYKENIFFVTVSSSPNLKLIVLRLIEQMAHDVPEFLNDDDAVKQLGYLLKLTKEPILLVLDDVWMGSIVQKLIFKIEGYKMLVTSRARFQTFDSIYSLKMLGHQDALTLFRHAAFPQDGSENYVPDEDHLNMIVRGCKGFPLALKVIADSLRCQPVEKWQSTERELSKGCSIFDSHGYLWDHLATSLHILNDTARECFLDLCSFPEHQRIPASALIDIWVEFYKLDDEDDAYIKLHELSTNNLVEMVESTRKDAGEIDGSLNELFIIQHDLLRDLAIYQSRQQSKRLIMNRREEGIPKSWREKDHQHLNARLVSIYTGEMCLTSWGNMQLPEVEILILNFLGMKYTLPPFMEKMGKLKVLIITNHECSHAKLSDLSALGYLSHLKRLRLEKVSIHSFDEITMPLNNLHKISLVNCEVGQALRNYTIEIPQIFPNLIEIDIDYCNDLVELPPGICDIIHMQKLSITNCHHLSTLPEGIGCMTNLEELRLHGCTKLAALPDSIQGFQKLKFLDLSDCLNLERLPEVIGKLRGLEKLDMRWCSRVRELPSSSRDLEHLKNVICDEETASLWEPLQVHFPEMKIKVSKMTLN